MRIGALCASKGNCSLICIANDVLFGLGDVAGSYPGIDIDIHHGDHLLFASCRRGSHRVRSAYGGDGVALPVCVSHVDLIRRSHASNVRVRVRVRLQLQLQLVARCSALRCSCKTEARRCRPNNFYIVSLNIVRALRRSRGSAKGAQIVFCYCAGITDRIGILKCLLLFKFVY